MKMQFCTPELPVTNISDAVSALVALGFREAWRYDDVFACVFGDGDIEIFLRVDEAPAPVTLYFKVDDADEFAERYGQCAAIETPLHDTPWGMREFTARVIDGHLFRIGHGQAEGEDRRVASQPE